MCTDPTHNHLAEPAVPDHLRCQWYSGSDRCPASATLTATVRGVAGHFCDPHAINVADVAKREGEPIQWAPFNPDRPAIEGAKPVSAPALPTGEIQGHDDTKRALAAYRGAATTYRDQLDEHNTKAKQVQAMANRIADDVGFSELGHHTMTAAAALAEAANKQAAITAKYPAAQEAVLAALAEMQAAVATHDGIAEAAQDNQDGGTTDWHKN